MNKEQHLSLAELNERVKQSIRNTFPENAWIVAEIGQIQENMSGHCYLDLIEKDEHSEKVIARNKANIWAYTYRMLKPFFETSTRKQFTVGIKVLINVVVEYHELYGLSLNIKDIDPAYTVGDLAMRKQRVIDQLQADGVFEMNKEIQLPSLVQKLAVISSATAAGYGDFMDELHQNKNGVVFYTCLFQAVMQGEQASSSIISALDRVYENIELFDAVLVIRGGGASMDLSCFDDYELAYYASQFPIPIMAGIGHERDESVLDLVANTSLKTPTAVAAFLVDRMSAQLAYLNDVQEQSIRTVTNRVEREKHRLEMATKQFPIVAKQYILQHENRISRIEEHIAKYPIDFLKRKKRHLLSLELLVARQTPLLLKSNQNKLNHLIGKARTATMHLLHSQSIKLNLLAELARSHNPQNVLKKGYSITYKNGKVVKSASNLREGDCVSTQLCDGEMASIVKSTKF